MRRSVNVKKGLKNMGRNSSNINIMENNRYDEESQIATNMELPTYSKTHLLTTDSPMMSKNPSMIILNHEEQLA